MNFIFVCADEMRAESVGCYGHPLVRTPNMDRLAAEGSRFDQCHVQHTVCSPSRCSYFTGWHPHVRGHRSLWHLLQPDEPNLLRYLKEAGHNVHWWGKNDTFAPQTWAGSVTEIHRTDGGSHGPNAFEFGQPGYYSFLGKPYEKPLEEQGDWRRVQDVVRFLRSTPRQPFTVNLNLIYPHCMYSAPQPWHDQYGPDKVPPLRPQELPQRPDFHGLIRRYRHLDRIDPAVLRKINAVYLGMIGFVDHLLGDLMRALADTGLDRETTLVFFSDHGDYAGDYGLVEKWPSGVEDVLTRVPLIIRTPGGRAGHVVAEPVELHDIMPTALELAGIRPRHTHFARSLVAQLRGERGDAGRAVFTEGGYDPQEPQCFEGLDVAGGDPRGIYYPKADQQQREPQSVSRCVKVRTAAHSLVRRPGGVCELYDLCADPRELRNVYNDPAHLPARAQLEQRLLDWLVQTADAAPAHRDSRGMPPQQST